MSFVLVVQSSASLYNRLWALSLYFSDEADWRNVSQNTKCLNKIENITGKGENAGCQHFP